MLGLIFALSGIASSSALSDEVNGVWKRLIWSAVGALLASIGVLLLLWKTGILPAWLAFVGRWFAAVGSIFSSGGGK